MDWFVLNWTPFYSMGLIVVVRGLGNRVTVLHCYSVSEKIGKLQKPKSGAIRRHSTSAQCLRIGPIAGGYFLFCSEPPDE